MAEHIIRFRSLLFLVLVLVSCTKEPDTSSSLQVTATPTLELPDVTPIPPKEKLIAAFDNSFPPFSDTNPSGELVGMDLDVLRVIADGAEMELSPVPMVWEAALEKLYSGEVHLLAGGITDSDFASEQVLYSEPYLDLDIKAVVLAESRTIVDVNQLPGLIVGLKSSSLAWETTGQLSGFLEIPPGNVRKYNDLRELMDALFAGQVDAIIINQIAFSEFDEANPSLLRVLNSNGSQDGDGSLGHYQFRFAVSPGGTETLALLNHGIKTLEQSGYIDDIAQSWGLSVEFGERPRFAQDAKAGSLIAGIEKVDDFTVRFVLNRPDPYFDYRLSVPSTAIQSPANLQLLSRSGQLSSQPVGTGPFQVDSWFGGQPVRLQAFDEYWGEPALLETIQVSPVIDIEQRFDLLVNKEVHLAENILPDDVEFAEDSYLYQVDYREAINVSYLGLNRDIVPFDENDVRMAIGTCIDRVDLTETHYPEGSIAATQFVPPSTFGFTPGLMWHYFDTSTATDLLSSAGYTDGITVTLTVVDVATDYLPVPLEIAEMVKEQLSECNVNVDIEAVSASEFYALKQSNRVGMYISGWSADFPGPINFLNTHFGKSADLGSFGAALPQVVDLLAEAERSADREHRRELYDEVNTILKEKVLFVPLAYGAGTWTSIEDLPGAYTHPVHREQFALIGPVDEVDELAGIGTEEKPFIIAVGSEPSTLDPSHAINDVDFLVITQIFETLVGYDAVDEGLVGILATEWASNDTYDVWEFSLKQDVRFHDGAEFNADAVLINFDRMWDTKHPLHVPDGDGFRYCPMLFGAFKEA